MVLEAGNITPPLDSVSTCLVSPGHATREQVSVPPKLLADSFTVVSEHLEVGKVVGDMCFVKMIAAVSLLPLE